MSPAEPAARKPGKAARQPSAPEGRRELQDIIRTSRAMQERRLNPFHVDIADALATADRYFGLWDALDDLTLDARALNALSRVVKMQEGRLRYQAQLFHADPEAMAEKLGKLDNEALGRLFLEAWHPVVELEQLTAEALGEALDYWDELEPVALRERERPRRKPPEPETVTLDDLLARGVIARDGFGSVIAELWDDLRARGSVPYQDFIAAPTYGQRVKRAYGTSYLITYGYAFLERRNGHGDGAGPGQGQGAADPPPLDAGAADALILHPKGAREPPKASVSLPILVVR